MLRHTLAMRSNHAERLTFVEHQPVLVLVFQLDLQKHMINLGSEHASQKSAHHFRQIQHHPIILKYPLCDDKLLGQLPSLSLPIPLDLLHDPLQILHIAMRIPHDFGSRDLQSLLNRKVYSAIRDDDVPSFGERRNGRRGGCIGLRVDYGIFCP